ncbi:MAG: aldehyde ferredoxin oxidoreductase family protein [Caldisphaera sp.]
MRTEENKKIKGGYAGKSLWINLSNSDIKIKDLDLDMVSKYIGGRGFIAKLSYNLINPDKDVYDPLNPLIFATGPLTGLAPASGRFTVGGRSPATHIHGDSNCGGDWSVELKMAGYDYIVITGKADHPVYISIQDNDVVIKNAKDLWGLTTHKTFELLAEKEENPYIKAVTIGPAGENLVSTAAIISTESRSASRAGMGAIMGAKNLKAISVYGTQDIKIADYELWENAFKNIYQIFIQDPMIKYVGRLIGSNYLHRVHGSHGALMVQDGHRGYFTKEEFEKISGETLNKYHVKGRSCFLCPVACTRSIYMNSDKYGLVKGRGPEYYSLQSLTYRCGGYDIEAGIYLNRLCDAYGLDATTLPSIIAFVMDLYENKIIKKDQIDGLELNWGNFDAIEKIIKAVAFKKDKIGKIFSKSITELIKDFGPKSEWYALQVKGLTFPSNDPRAGQVYNMRYAIATRGADHLRASGLSSGTSLDFDSLPEVDGMKAFINLETYVTLVNLFEVCNWAYSAYTSSFENADKKEKGMYELFNSATGLNFRDIDFKNAALATILTERAENARYGIRKKDDYFPERVFDEPLPINEKGETRAYSKDKFERLLNYYYEMRGIDNDGLPKSEVLKRLKLNEIDLDLEKYRNYGK